MRCWWFLVSVFVGSCGVWRGGGAREEGRGGSKSSFCGDCCGFLSGPAGSRFIPSHRFSCVKILHTKPRFLFCFPSPFLPKTFLSSFPRYFRQEWHGNKKHHNNWAFLVLVLLRGFVGCGGFNAGSCVLLCIFFLRSPLCCKWASCIPQERVGRGGPCSAANRASSAPAAHSALECVAIAEVRVS